MKTSGFAVGALIAHAVQDEPNGWLICDGREVSRTTFADLFSTVGTTWGVGDGSTTFNLPDLRGRTPIGVNDSSLVNGVDGGVSTRNLTQEGGEETHTLTVAELPTHTHTYDGGTGSAGGGVSPSGVTDMTTDNSGSTGNGDPHENMPPYAVITWLIRYKV